MEMIVLLVAIICWMPVQFQQMWGALFAYSIDDIAVRGHEMANSAVQGIWPD